MKRYIPLFGLALLALLVGVKTPLAQAYNPLYQSVPVTPDLAVTASATAGYAFSGGPIRWISIKNDCASTIYFDLRGNYVGTKPTASYGMRLNSGETFTMPVQLYTLGVSPASGSPPAACTFSVQAGK